jgi:hypothetical protein
MDINKLSTEDLEIIQSALESEKGHYRVHGNTSMVVNVLLVQSQIECIIQHQKRIKEDAKIVAEGLAAIKA